MPSTQVRRRARSAAPRPRGHKAMGIAQRIMQLRETHGWSPEELRERCGVSGQTVRFWECGGCLPSDHSLSVLASVFGTTPEYLLTGYNVLVQAPLTAEEVPTYDPITLGDRLRLFLLVRSREEGVELGSNALSERSGVGKGVIQSLRLDAGNNYVSLGELEAIAQALHVSPSVLLLGVETEIEGLTTTDIARVLRWYQIIARQRKERETPIETPEGLIPLTFGERFRQVRLRSTGPGGKPWSCQELSVKLGFTRTIANHWENNKVRPEPESRSLRQAAALLGTTEAYLLAGITPEEAARPEAQGPFRYREVDTARPEQEERWRRWTRKVDGYVPIPRVTQSVQWDLSVPFGKTVTALREAKMVEGRRMMKRELAKAIERDNSAITLIENGRVIPLSDVLDRMAVSLGVSVARLLTGNDQSVDVYKRAEFEADEDKAHLEHETRGERLFRLCEEVLEPKIGRKVTNTVLAEMVGVKIVTPSKWINNQSVPSGARLLKLAELLETTPEYILNGEKRAQLEVPTAENGAPAKSKWRNQTVEERGFHLHQSDVLLRERLARLGGPGENEPRKLSMLRGLRTVASRGNMPSHNLRFYIRQVQLGLL